MVPEDAADFLKQFQQEASKITQSKRRQGLRMTKQVSEQIQLAQMQSS